MAAQPTEPPALPSLHVLLTPQPDYAENSAIKAIGVTICINNTEVKAGSPLLELLLARGSTPTCRYDDDALTASDDEGTLLLSYSDSEERNPKRTWVPTREPVGKVVVQCVAHPRKIDMHAAPPAGPRVDLRADQGGLVGAGWGFLPRPPGEDNWDIRIEWKVPEPDQKLVRFASSLGDGRISTVMGRPEVVSRSLFAVGPLQRWPAWATEDSTPDSKKNDFGLYWLGRLPYDSERTAKLTMKLHDAIATFFGDEGSSFRVFVRTVPDVHGGMGGYKSFLLEVHDGVEHEMSEDGLIDLLAHEIVHEYPLTHPMRQEDSWYVEGIANYYAPIAPFYGKAVGRDFLIRMLNNNAQAYYTTNVINLEWKYICEHYFDNFEITKAAYGRGFMFFAQVQGLVANATDGKKGFDDLALEMYRKYQARDKCQGEDFVQLLGQIVGDDLAQKCFADMKLGRAIVPHPDCFAKYGLKLVRRDAERFEAGFNPNSLRTNKIFGLVKGSRAEAAGICEGDEVVASWMLWGAGDAPQNQMRVVVKKNGKEEAIQYWPRSYEKVECWQWDDISNDNH